MSSGYNSTLLLSSYRVFCIDLRMMKTIDFSRGLVGPLIPKG